MKDLLNKQLKNDKKLCFYLLVRSPQHDRFYQVHKIHKCITNMPWKSVIFNNDTAAVRISAYLEYHLKPKAPAVLYNRIRPNQYPWKQYTVWCSSTLLHYVVWGTMKCNVRIPWESRK